jgi:hypothetical protein
LLLAVNSSLAASIAAKATTAITLGLCAAWLARHQRASLRHAILAAASAVLLAIPIAALVSPDPRRCLARSASTGASDINCAARAHPTPAAQHSRHDAAAPFIRHPAARCLDHRGNPLSTADDHRPMAHSRAAATLGSVGDLVAGEPDGNLT